MHFVLILVAIHTSVVFVDARSFFHDKYRKQKTSECKGWIKGNERCYKVYTEEKYFSSAENICLREKAHLVSISNGVENNHISKITNGAEIWIGLKKENLKFVWFDGYSTFRNWMFSRPTNKGICVKMISGGGWVDTSCYEMLPFVCQKDRTKYTDVKVTQYVVLLIVPAFLVGLMLAVIIPIFLNTSSQISHVKREMKSMDQLVTAVIESNYGSNQSEENDENQTIDDTSSCQVVFSISCDEESQDDIFNTVDGLGVNSSFGYTHCPYTKFENCDGDLSASGDDFIDEIKTVIRNSKIKNTHQYIYDSDFEKSYKLQLVEDYVDITVMQ
ncbi:uncharacterized protein LOC130612422 [Hydractinia symbiolongicarpus]|uniref:uncharacterized protein LOC130612422 n=1 Tax=Hydractinia symbiolongicarpus TaxID=13093 RepID=UPI00254E7339|nr:uncharacterized protein LOC130612422 [Hydractinia symbiolongicarpus]